MKKPAIFLVLLICITFSLSAVDNLVFNFKPDTVFILSVETHQLDLIYLLGTLEDGERIAVTVGRKKINTGNSDNMEMTLTIDNIEYTSVDEILANCRSTWYKVTAFLDEYRSTTEDLFSVLYKEYGIEKYTSATEIESILPITDIKLVLESGVPLE